MRIFAFPIYYSILLFIDLSNTSISFWEKTSFLNAVDVAIIGGGIVGLNAALEVKRLAPKAKVLILERGSLPQGASTKNAGFACFGSPTELLDDLATTDADTVWKTVEARWQGLQKLRKKVGDLNLNYQAFGGYEIFRPEEATIFEKCSLHLNDLNHQFTQITGQRNAFQIANERIPSFRFQGINQLIVSRLEGQLHPGKMVQSLQRLAREAGIEQLFGVQIEAIEEETKGLILKGEKAWLIRAQKVLIATNGFAKQLLPRLETQAVRNQILVTNEIPNLPFRACFHYDRGYFYFRNVGKCVLVGGGRHLDKVGEQTDQFGTSETIQNALLNLLRTVILPNQDFQIKHQWSGILGVGNSKQPILNMQSTRLGIAVQLGGMGVAIGTLVGEQGAKMLLGK